MSKRNAHLVAILLDVFVVYMVWYGYSEVVRVFHAIGQLAESVTFGNRIGFAFAVIIMPSAQLLGIYEYFWPGDFNKRRITINRAANILGIGLIAGAILFSVYLQKHVEDAGYVYCDGAMRPGSIFKTLVYARDQEVCRRLTNEYRLSMHLPPK